MPLWQKASFSGGGGSGECVEVATDTDASSVLLRESDRPKMIARAARAPWSAFLSRIKSGAYDRPSRTTR